MDHIVVDVEIQKTIQETPGGWDATDKLGVSVACVWEHKGQRMRIYGPQDIDALRKRLFRATRITGFNIWRFDFPVIWGLSRAEWDQAYASDVEKLIQGDPLRLVAELQAHLLPKTNDLLRRIWISKDLDPNAYDQRTHGGLGLNAITSLLLGHSKIGYGGDAPLWYQAGEWAKVANYCADDVALERDLSDFIDRYGFIIDPKTHRRMMVTESWGV